MVDKDYELQFKEEQIKDLLDVVKGTVKASGKLRERDGRKHWEINTSSILTKLIQETGRWCENYASDLFDSWVRNVEEKLKDGSLDSSTVVFAMRKGGVDHMEWYLVNKDKSDYYRAVWFLDVTVNDKEIEMVLHK